MEMTLSATLSEKTNVEFSLCRESPHCLTGTCMPSLDDSLCFAKDLVLFLALKQEKVRTPLLVFEKGSR